MNKHLHIIILIIVFSLTSTGAAADDPKGQYYPLDNLYVSPYYGYIEEFADDDIPIVEKTGLPSLKEYLHTSVIIGYSRAFGLPPVIVTELAAVFFRPLGGGALTCLFTRRPNPVHRNPRTQAVYSLIQENPRITMAELEEITGYSRGSINYSISEYADNGVNTPARVPPSISSPTPKSVPKEATTVSFASRPMRTATAASGIPQPSGSKIGALVEPIIPMTDSEDPYSTP